MRKVIIGVMGPGRDARSKDVVNAAALGRMIAEKGWVLLSGGRHEGVMEAVNIAAFEAGGLTIGILPGKDPHEVSRGVAIPIYTDMGSARNNINVLSSDVVVVCGMGSGTASEAALAIKAGKHVVLLGCEAETVDFFRKIGGSFVAIAATAEDAVGTIEEILQR